ncbi:hypothetical protein BGZ73_006523 [Actinomortierella ambigua]|nr:hypothetical protein BGZ73_006523 [Actinomortierella ambigua]
MKTITIHTAAFEGKLDHVQSIVQQDKNAILKKDEDERQALHWAASGKHLDIVEFLLEHGAPVNEKDESLTISRRLSAVSKGHIEIARELLAHAADPNIQDNRKQTAMHRAAAKGATALVKLLIEKKSRLNTPDSVRNTPLHLACQEEHGETALVLIEAGADVDRTNGESKTPLDYCSPSVRAFLQRHGHGVE